MTGSTPLSHTRIRSVVAGRLSSSRTSSSYWPWRENRARWRPTTTRRSGQEGLGLGRVDQRGEAPSPVGVPEAGLVELLQRQAAVLVAQRLLRRSPRHRLGQQHRVVAGDELDAHSGTPTGHTRLPIPVSRRDRPGTGSPTPPNGHTRLPIPVSRRDRPGTGSPTPPTGHTRLPIPVSRRDRPGTGSPTPPTGHARLPIPVSRRPRPGTGSPTPPTGHARLPIPTSHRPQPGTGSPTPPTGHARLPIPVSRRDRRSERSGVDNDIAPRILRPPYFRRGPRTITSKSGSILPA